MDARKGPQPGALPQIQVSDGSITYLLEVAGVRRAPVLVLRCDAAGHVWASIELPRPDRHA